MRKAAFIVVASFYFLFVCAVSANASRGLKITQIDELSHRSGKLGEYKALVIGINDYKDPNVPDLETAVNDANAVARVLKDKYGFKVEFLLDEKATREAIYKQLRTLAVSTKPDDSVLIYYAGHGDLDRAYNDGWWIPSDATGGNPVTYLSNVQVQIAIRSMKARHVLLISDSCYSGMLFGKARGLPHVIDDKYYLSLYNEKSRWGMTSGNKEPVSDAGSEGHSVFAYQLLKELKQNNKPFISIQEIYTRIAPIISNNSEQTPLCRPIQNTGDQGGEFVFVAAITEEPTPVISKPQVSTIDKDAIFWQSIQNSDEPALYEAYIQKFPNGTFVPIAQFKLAKLKERKPSAAGIPVNTKPQSAPEVIKARLFVETKPANARVRILNIKPEFHQGIELNPGRYPIEVTAKGYVTKKQWIKISAEEEKRISIALKQTPLTGTLHVSGLPYGANVYIDGNYRGKMPVLVDNVTPGSHHVRVQADGYLEKSERLSIDPRENKTLKVNLKKVDMVIASDGQYDNKIVERNGRYEKYENGIVHDTVKGLEWYAGPDRDFTWWQAKNWLKRLNVDSGGWRMPTIGELKGLYQIGSGTRNMTPLLKTTGWSVWSDKYNYTWGSSKIFSFKTGEMSWEKHNHFRSNRSFAVRSQR